MAVAVRYFFFGPLFFIGSLVCFGLSLPDFFPATEGNLLSSRVVLVACPGNVRTASHSI